MNTHVLAALAQAATIGYHPVIRQGAPGSPSRVLQGPGGQCAQIRFSFCFVSGASNNR
jgi:hypothetical protein